MPDVLAEGGEKPKELFFDDEMKQSNLLCSHLPIFVSKENV